MTTPTTEKLTEIEDQVVETVSKLQEPVISSVRRAVELVEGVVPDLNVPRPQALPSAREIVDNQFDFVSRLLELNHQFVLAILEAVKPLELKVVDEAKPAAKTKKTTPKAEAA